MRLLVGLLGLETKAAEDALDRRTQATLADGSRWVYAYSNRDVVIGGKRACADWSPVAGQRFEYGFDGHRLPAEDGGGDSLRTPAYSANRLDQYGRPRLLLSPGR